MRKCKNCKKVLIKRSQKVYCSVHCQQHYRYTQYIIGWKKGILPKITDASTKSFPPTIKKYFLATYGEKCMICGWKKKHPKTGKSPLEMDHIDGNTDNNKESNLRLVCPNCHALTENFRGYNKGRGRKWRMDRYKRIT